MNGVMKDLSKMSEDQLMIWKRLNDIRLNQDLEDKVPALQGIAKRRIREELIQVVEEVAAHYKQKTSQKPTGYCMPLLQ